MTRDPSMYINPEEFSPERFLSKDNQLTGDDMSYAFGFGRRSVLYLSTFLDTTTQIPCVYE